MYRKIIKFCLTLFFVFNCSVMLGFPYHYNVLENDQVKTGILKLELDYLKKSKVYLKISFDVLLKIKDELLSYAAKFHRKIDYYDNSHRAVAQNLRFRIDPTMLDGKTFDGMDLGGTLQVGKGYLVKIIDKKRLKDQMNYILSISYNGRPSEKEKKAQGVGFLSSVKSTFNQIGIESMLLKQVVKNVKVSMTFINHKLHSIREISIEDQAFKGELIEVK